MILSTLILLIALTPTSLAQGGGGEVPDQKKPRRPTSEEKRQIEKGSIDTEVPSAGGGSQQQRPTPGQKGRRRASQA